MDEEMLSHKGEPPAYLDNTDIHGMFHWLLDCLDKLPSEQRTRSISRPVNAKHFGTLFKPGRADDDFVLWELLQRCQQDGLIRIQSEKKRRDPHLPPWSGMRIIFDPESEPLLRQWLKRPLMTPEAMNWQLALGKYAHAFKRIELLTRPMFTQLGKPADEIVSRLAAIPALVAKHPLSAYQVSARLF